MFSHFHQFVVKLLSKSNFLQEILDKIERFVLNCYYHNDKRKSLGEEYHMKQICKRMLALLLALTMLMSFGTAFAAELPVDETALTQTDGNALPPEEAAGEELTPEDVGEEVSGEEVDETDADADADTPEEEEDALLNASVSYFSDDELFVYIGKSVAPTMKTAAPEGAEFTSNNTSVVTVNKTTGKLKGVGTGKATITLKSGGTKLDTLTVYGYQYTTFTKTATNNTASPLTVKTTTGSVVHTYKTFNQQAQYDEGGHRLTNLSSHGCGISSTAELAQGFGLTDVTPVWLHQEGVPAMADSLGITLGNAMGTGSGARPLGFYGMQYTLGQLGISSKVYTWTKNTQADAVLEMTKALSEGRPLIVVVYKDKWNGIQLTSGYHFLLLTGIDKNGYVIFLNTTGGKVRYAMGATRKLTVSELVTHFIRSDIKHTNTKDFFYYQPTGSGCMACLEVTSNTLGKRKLTVSGKPSITKATVTLSKSSYTYSGAARKPSVTVKIGSKTLKEGVDYTYWHNNNINASTSAVTTIRGAGSYTGLMQKTFTINRAANTITASDQAVTGATKAQTLQLSATAKGSAKITYSTTDKNVKVTSAGKVTIPANYGGKAIITATSAQTTNYKKTTKDITVTITGAKNTITASDKTVAASDQEQTVQLSATARDNAKITYSTTDETVKVSSDGLVTIPAGYSGTVTITVTAKKSTYYKKTTKNITLTVTASKNTITIDNQVIPVSAKEQTVQLKAKALGGAALTYSTDSKDVTVTADGKVTIPANYTGNVSVVVTAAATGLYTQTSKTITLSIRNPDNTITAKNKTVAVATKKQTVQLSASALDSAAVTFSTTDTTVKVSKAGKVTIPANYAGSVTITVTSAATASYAKTTKKITVTVKPAAVTLSSVKSNAAGKITGKWTKNAAASGYEFQYSTTKDFTSGKVSVAVSGAANVSKTVSKLTKGKKYYIRVRCYKTYNKKNYSSDWSNSKSVTVKK